MINIWLILGCLVASCVSGVLTCGLIFAVGGLGVVNRRLNALEGQMVDQEGKTLSLQKKMASRAGVEARNQKLSNSQMLFELKEMQRTGTDDDLPSTLKR